MKRMTNMIRESKKIASNIRNTAMDIITSISQSGKTMNTKTYSDSENRGLRIFTPYGISSSGVDGILAQVIINDNQHGSMVGVHDKNRPDVKIGELILYSNFSSKIKLADDGKIYIDGDIIVSGDIIISGSLTADSLEITNDAHIGGDIISGSLTADSLEITNGAHIGGNLTVDGTIT